MKLFKEKYIGSILKFYKIPDKNIIDINVFRLCLDIVKQYTNETLDKVNLNMRHTDWNLNKLLVHIKATNEKIEFLEAYTSKPSLKLLENNSAINYGVLKTVSKKEHFIEIAINFNNFMLNKSDNYKYT